MAARRVAHVGAAQTAERLVDAATQAAWAEDVRDVARLTLQGLEETRVQSDLAVLLALVRIDARRALGRGQRVLLLGFDLAELAFLVLVLAAALLARQLEFLLLFLLLGLLQEELGE